VNAHHYAMKRIQIRDAERQLAQAHARGWTAEVFDLAVRIRNLNVDLQRILLADERRVR